MNRELLRRLMNRTVEHVSFAYRIRTIPDKAEELHVSRVRERRSLGHNWRPPAITIFNHVSDRNVHHEP